MKLGSLDHGALEATVRVYIFILIQWKVIRKFNQVNDMV